MAENDKIELIKLQDIVELSKKYITGEVSQEGMADYGNNMTIRSAISIKEKKMLIDTLTLLQDIDYMNDDANYITVNLYRNLFFYGILGYYGMIDCSDKTLITDENYDLLYPIFASFILSYCQADFDLVKEMLYQAINFSNIKAFLSALDAVDEEKLTDAADGNKLMMEELQKNRELIAQLNNIAVMNDPKTAELVQDLAKLGEKM